jgi:uncharacterized membrane protein YeaQ/YmgE (transglycosylase-associated protein family)
MSGPNQKAVMDCVGIIGGACIAWITQFIQTATPILEFFSLVGSIIAAGISIVWGILRIAQDRKSE